jgi:ribose transport system permease protein
MQHKGTDKIMPTIVPRRLTKALQSVGRLPLAVFAFVVLVALIQPAILSVTNIENVGRQGSILAIVACGQLFTVLVGGVDHSLGSIIGLTSVIAAMSVLSFGLYWGLLAGLLVGVALGAVNGLLVAYFAIPPMIGTLAMLYFAHGAALIITGGMPVERLPADFGTIGKGALLHVPLPVFVAAAVALICALILTQTRSGRGIYAIGGGKEISRLADIAVDRYTLLAFIVSGLLAGLAGIVLSSRLSSGQPNLGEGLEFQSIAAVVIGGARLGGGRGTIAGALIGACFLAVLSNGLNLARVSSFAQLTVIGCVLIVAMIVDRLRFRSFHIAR